MSNYSLIQQVLTKLNAFSAILESTSDVDTTINKWNEVVNFLATVQESDTLVSLLSGYISKTTDLVGNLTSTATDKALRADQGKILKDSIDAAILQIAGSADRAYVNDNTTLDANSRKIYAKFTATGKAITLPAAPTEGMSFSILLTKDSTFGYTLNGNGKNINGAATQAIAILVYNSTNYDTEISVIYDSHITEWRMI